MGPIAHMSVVVPLRKILTLVLALLLMEEPLYQKVSRLPLVKESFSLITEIVVRSAMIVITMSGSKDLMKKGKMCT